jgi:hypothetical protein
MLCLAIVLSSVSFISFILGMVFGFWPDGHGSFSFYQFFTSSSGIAVFVGYTAGLNLVYYCLEKTGIIARRKRGALPFGHHREPFQEYGRKGEGK